MESLESAVFAFKNIVGAGNTVTDEESLALVRANIGDFKRKIPALVRPANVCELREIMRIANDAGTKVYPISKGKNWGLGSKNPVTDGCVVLDLGRMDKIRALDTVHGYAIVEPGVTQVQLYDKLKGTGFIFDATGSAQSTSILGNALDRGVGYHKSRADEITGLEVVLANGDVFKTGFGHFDGARADHLYRHGVGPDLTGLFLQSNLGIVTALGIQLIPEREKHVAVKIGIEDELDFGEFVDRLARLRRMEVIETAFHLANKDRGLISIAPAIYDYLRSKANLNHEEAMQGVKSAVRRIGLSAWSAIGGVMGTKGEVDEKVYAIRREMSGFADVKVLDERKIRLLGLMPGHSAKVIAYALNELYGLTRGVPTNVALGSVYWPVSQSEEAQNGDPDHSDCGLLYCLPMIPAAGIDAAEVIRTTREVCGSLGFVPYVTMNFASAGALECVINIAYRKNESQRATSARACIDLLQDKLVSEGYYPYRVDIDRMPKLIESSDQFWRVVKSLKDTLDPKGIIAPGRYCLL